MKGMKAMKKVKKVSIVAKGKLAKVAVFKGKKVKTVGGLTKATLTKSKSGKIVSKAASARGKKAWASSALKKWGMRASRHAKLWGSRAFVQWVGRRRKERLCMPRPKPSSASEACRCQLG